MNYFDLYSSYPDHTIAAAWDSQVKDCVATPFMVREPHHERDSFVVNANPSALSSTSKGSDRTATHSLKGADKTPGLADTLTGCGEELFARFAACYAELRTLPRSARRALQRQLARSSELAAILPEYLQNGGRRLQHRMAWSLAGAALLLALGQGVGTAATITVTTNNPNIASDGQCSLIEAIVNANNDAATYPDCPAGSGADTIVLPANANLMLSNPYGALYTGANGTVSGPPLGLPPIASQITIEGNGATISRAEGAPAFGLMAVRAHAHVFPASPPTGPSGDLTLKNVTLSGGLDGGAPFNGGGAILNSGTLTIENSTMSGNTSGGYTGTLNNSGTLTIENSTIAGNTARGIERYNGNLYGDVIIDNSGTLTIENSTISGNTGSGVHSYGNLTIQSSTISGNMDRGVDNSYANLTIQNSTISANGGEGVANFAGQVTVTNSTISGNSGGLSNTGTVSGYCEFWGQCSPGILTLNNSLIAGNHAGGDVANNGVVNASNFNLFGAGLIGFTPGPTDIVATVPLEQIIGPLQNNGGPTQTHALVAGSPAIDAGDPNGCRDNSGALLLKDQRGFPRAVDGNSDGTARCDIGAVELNSRDLPFTLVAAVLPSSRSVQVGTPATAFATIINTDSNMATGCAISPSASIPATLTFQTTDPATNQVIGAPNGLVDIPAGAAQSFVFALTPTAPMDPTDIQLSFDCANTDPAPIIPGVNTLLFSASATPTPDIVALVATLSGDGIVNLSGTNGVGAFAVASVNVGAGDAFTVSADTGGAALPVNVFICQTDPKTSVCLSPPDTSVPTTILFNETPTFGVFVAAQGDIAFFPEINRIFVRFKDSGGVTRGLTSVAVRTSHPCPPDACCGCWDY